MGHPTNTRPPFSPSLLILAISLTLLALTVRPNPYRWIYFLPITSIYCYLTFWTTTGDAAADFGVGCGIMTQLLYTVDYILLTDVQTELRLKGQTVSISSAGFADRLRWAVKLFLTPRGIGWTHASSSIQYPRKPASRTRFVCTKVLEMLVCIILERSFFVMNHFNPAMKDSEARSAQRYGVYYQAVGVLGFALAGFAGMNFCFCITSALSVLFGLSEPKDWPDLYGSIWNAYSVQRLWSRTWHQLLRRPLSTIADFLVYKVFHLRRGGAISSTIWLWTVFIVSGFTHLGGEYMLLQRISFGAFRYFLLQAAAISVEKVVVFLFGIETSKTKTPLRLLGYLWVLVWSVWTLPFIVNPNIEVGMFGRESEGLEKFLEYVGI